MHFRLSATVSINFIMVIIYFKKFQRLKKVTKYAKTWYEIYFYKLILVVLDISLFVNKSRALVILKKTH